MSDDKMREEFEAWYVGEYLIPGETMLRAHDAQGGKAEHYQRYQEEVQWAAWQASRAALAVELPFEFVNGMMRADQVIAAIEAAGVRVKP